MCITLIQSKRKGDLFENMLNYLALNSYSYKYKSARNIQSLFIKKKERRKEERKSKKKKCKKKEEHCCNSSLNVP